MAFNFPSSPTLNQTYTLGSSTYKYNGSAWISLASVASFDAMVYSGLQINGACDVDQWGLGNIVLSGQSESYFTDMWTVWELGGLNGALASPDTALGVPPGFTRYVRIYCTGGQTPGASDAAGLRMRIEGHRTKLLKWGTAEAQPITISFWVLGGGGATGTITVSVQNQDSDRTYLANVPVTASMWTYQTVTVPGCADGYWRTTHEIGMMLAFCVSCGATYQGTNNAWQTGFKIGTSATSNMFDTLDKQIAITGLTVLPGAQAPTAAQSPNIQRPFAEELRLCQRYLQIVGGLYRAWVSSAATWTDACAYLWPEPMRIAPTCSFAGFSESGTSSSDIPNISATGFSIRMYAAAGGVSNVAINTAVVGDARM